VVSLAEDLDTRTNNTEQEDLWPAMRRSAACLKAGITLDQLEVFHSKQPLLRQA
jgi:hypothetical protein